MHAVYSGGRLIRLRCGDPDKGLHFAGDGAKWDGLLGSLR